MSLLAVPLLHLTDDLQLLPATTSEQHPDSAERPSQQEPRPPVVSPPRDLTQEGPLDAFCALPDTSDHPLITGCPYRMTSYDIGSLADPGPGTLGSDYGP